MAASKGYFARANYRFFSSDHHAPPLTPDALLDLDESDIWTNSPPSEIRKPSTPKVARKYSSPIRIDRAASGAGARGGSGGGQKYASLPVNIPDWSKILKEEYRENRRRDSDDDDDDFDHEGGDDWVPPHEFLARQMARTRIASFSVHEGIGRTLKGRDLSRVRNAIWEKTGFQD